jgi:hemerythrin-like domain-containing protein
LQAIRIIEHEHRSLAAVLHGLLYLMREIRYAATEPDFELLNAMLHYIDAFSERFHHPKEDAYLFERLGVRLPAAASLIDRLKQEHRSGTLKLQALQHALTQYQQTGSAAFPEFASRVAGFAAFHWDHMRLEEDDLVPLARLHLTGADWDAIDAAFLGHTDPLFGVERGAEYQELFRRIVELAPPPLGKASASTTLGSRFRENDR